MNGGSRSRRRRRRGGEVWGRVSPPQRGRGLGGDCAPSPENVLNFYPEMVHFCAFCSSNFGVRECLSLDVEGQWDFYPNLRLILSIWLNCAVSFVKFATVSRSGGTHIPNADFHHLYNHFIYTRRPLEHP